MAKKQHIKTVVKGDKETYYINNVPSNKTGFRWRLHTDTEKLVAWYPTLAFLLEQLLVMERVDAKQG